MIQLFLNVTIMMMNQPMELVRKLKPIMKKMISILLREWARRIDHMERMEEDQEEEETSLEIEMTHKVIKQDKVVLEMIQRLNQRKTQKINFIDKNQKMVLDLTKEKEKINKKSKTKRRIKRRKDLEGRVLMQMVLMVNRKKLQDSVQRMEILMISLLSFLIHVRKL